MSTPNCVNIMDNEQIKSDILAGKREAICTYCKLTPCYDLSVQQGHLVGLFLFDEQKLVCRQCYDFMNKTGRLTTIIVRILLKINVIFRSKRTSEIHQPKEAA